MNGGRSDGAFRRLSAAAARTRRTVGSQDFFLIGPD
jgi:hypothetical protein